VAVTGRVAVADAPFALVPVNWKEKLPSVAGVKVSSPSA